MKYCLLLIIASLRVGIGFSQVQSTDSIAAVQNKKDTVPYATLIFYRSYIPKMNAPLKKVPIIINDTLISSLKANTIMTLKVSQAGKI